MKQVESKSTTKKFIPSETVVMRLREMIRDGELGSGDRLPPERDLARQMGVSRPTLRAGIRSLAAVGLLESRRGAGTFVARPDESPTLDASQLKMLASLHNFSADEMFEARIALEMAIAGCAAERASGEQIALLAEEIAGMFASLDRPARFLEHDLKFHRTIALASGNQILTALMNMVAQVWLETRSKTVGRARDLKESALMHQKIYRAIRQKDAAAAREAMREHLLATQAAQSQEI
ncbi:MAG: FadR family transcriptional regulator [Acidobacteria bacterium]|nr:FadR family transcriptional regulator [Acidobacteriota bacterium]